MSLSVLSLNFKTAPVEVRERLSVSPADAPALLDDLRLACGLAELMVLSTCNRVEFFFTDDPAGTGGAALRDWLRGRMGELGDDAERAAVLLTQRAALTHLFRVAASLESMVLGEPQILGQVKEAFQLAVAHRCHGALLTGLMPRVFRAAKRVRTETAIARFPVSVGHVAVRLAGQIFESLAERTVLVIGAGDMAELTVRQLMEAGANRLLITNRTFARAVELAERFQGSAVRFEELARILPEADVVISSTGAKGHVVTQEMARRATRARRGAPIFFIDIAVPRDVDPAVNGLPNVFRYDVDDLQGVTDANMAEREREASRAQEIVEEEVRSYEQWLHSHSVVPVIKALRRHFQEVGEQELEAALDKLGPVPDEAAHQVRRMVRSLVNKLLHEPSTRLKEGLGEAAGPLHADALVELFGLAPAEPAGPAAEHDDETAPEPGGKVVRWPLTSKSS